VLEAAGLPPPANPDGRSFADLLRGQKQPARDRVFTQIDTLVSGFPYPMRCVQDHRFAYIVNFWSDGETRYRNNNEGQTMAAMEAAARTDAAIAQRVWMFRLRVPEELYDLQEDPGGLRNLANDPAHAETLARLRGELEKWMLQVKDPFLQAFRQRGDDVARRAAILEAYGPSETWQKNRN
jgi:N-sulfoglucosamine sulfohydrolase